MVPGNASNEVVEYFIGVSKMYMEFKLVESCIVWYPFISFSYLLRVSLGILSSMGSINKKSIILK